MKYFHVVLLLITSSVLFAQRPQQQIITITGIILEEDINAPLEYATVSVINTNNEIVTGGITNEKGAYSIDIPVGIYTIRYEFISFKTKEISNQKLFKNTKLPIVKLTLDADNLNEVIVRAETTEVSIRLDKKVYNIGKDLTTSGATVSDALNNVPSVTVDVDGAIALRGNENVRILINGKPSAIAGFGGTDALRQLPAEAIERVEVITSPSARYDAEGTAGILNIILRKEKTLGVNGSYILNGGYPERIGATGNINIRTDKFNVFNTTGINYRKSPGNAFFNTVYKNIPEDSDRNPLITETRDYDRLRRNFNTNLGIEYFITKKSSITASGFLSTGNGDNNTTNSTNEFDISDTLTINRIREENEERNNTNFQTSLNYINNLDTNGHKLTIDAQFEKNKRDEQASINETNTFPEIQRLAGERVNSLERQTEYLLQADYVRPIGENAQFEAGFRFNFRENETDYSLLEELDTSGIFVIDQGLTNVFTFEQNIAAAYLQYGNKWKEKFSYLLGLRLENTELIGSVIANENATIGFDANFDKNYLGLFPTINITYEIGEKENLTLGYNRRINRPRGFFINPFPSRSSESNVFQGNPSIDPAFSNAFDVGYLRRWKKITLTSSIYYQRETNSFERIQEDTGEFTPNGVPIIRTFPINLSTNDRYGFEAGVLYNAIKWLRLNGSFNYFNFVTEGAFNGIDYGTENSSWFARSSAKITLPAKIDWQTNAFYRGPRNNSQTTSDGIFSLSIAVSKDLFKDNATLGFNIRDVLNSRKRNSVTNTPSFRQESEFQWRERQFNLSFTYRFNQKKQRSRGNRTNNGGDDEEFGG